MHEPMGPPLAGLRVFDMTIAGAGPRAGRMLAELGAEVIKVEDPGEGDVMLGRPPTQHGMSVGYTHFNRGKLSVFLDLRKADDLGRARALIRECDIFLNNMRPGVAERLGVGYEDVALVNPRIIYGYLSAWGRRGPMASWPGADPVVQFFSGWCSIQGEEGTDGEFGRYVGHIDDAGAAFLVGGVLQALIQRERTGRGQRVDVSLLKASLVTQITRISEHLAGSTPKPMGSACATSAPHEAIRCGDGKYLAVGVLHDEHWRALCSALGADRLATDPRFATNEDRVRERPALTGIVQGLFQRWPSNWIQILLERARVPHGRFYDWESIRYHVQVIENRYITRVDVPHQGRLYLVDPPWRLSGSDAPTLRVPRPGADTADVMSRLRFPGGPDDPTVSDDNDRPRADAPPERSLQGVRVVDVTQGLCGPFVSQLLADAGADVVKIEPPDGDYARRTGPPFIDRQSALFLTLNRGKKSAVLDLSKPSDLDVLRQLVAKADVFLEDWALAGAAKPLEYEELAALNPRLVYGAITGFGDRGPLAERPASELVVQAASEYGGGLGPVAGPPVRMGADVANISTAVYMFDVLLAALLQKSRHMRGQRVTVSQFGTLLYARGTVWASQGDPDEWDGWAARQFMPPDHGYEAKDGRVYFLILRGDQEEFDGLMLELGLEQYLSDPRFASGGRNAVGIGRYAAEVKPIWEAVFRERTVEELTELVRRHGGLIAPLHTYESLFADPRVAELGLLVEVSHVGGGRYRTLGSPWDFSELSTTLATGSAPLLGQHQGEVLRERVSAQ